MRIVEYEQLVLSAAFLDRGVMPQLAAEISDIAFNYGPDGRISESHRLIYRAMLTCYQGGQAIDIATVAAQLGDRLDFVGGTAYLQQLVHVLARHSIRSTQGLPDWAGRIDKAGRFIGMQNMLARYADQISDAESVVDRIDIDDFYSELVTSLGRANQVQTQYRVIAEAVGDAQRRIAAEVGGRAVSWLPIPWNSTRQFRLVPRDALVVLTGLSSIGKSQLAAEFLLGAAIQLRRQDLPGVVAFNTFEIKGWEYAARMGSCLAKVDLLSPGLFDENSDECMRLGEALDFVSHLPIVFDDADATSMEIEARSLQLSQQSGGIHLLVIDYNELLSDVNTASEELRLAAIFRRFRRLARRLNCCVLVVSQQTVEPGNKTRLAQVGQTRYTRVGWHACNVYLQLYNIFAMRAAGIDFRLPSGMSDDGFAHVYVQKNTHGVVGQFPLRWNPSIVRFSDPTMDDGILFDGFDEVWDNWKQGGTW